MKNILIVSTSVNTQGGVSTVVNNIINSDLAKKYSFIHLSAHINGNFLIKLLYMIRSYIYFPFLLIFKEIPVIHIHGSMKSSFLRKSYFLILGKLFRKKIIYHMHSAMIEEYLAKCSKFKRSLITLLFNMYDQVIVISSSWANVLKKITKTPVLVIYNSIPMVEILKESKNSQSNIVIFTLGEIGERKGTDDIIRIARQINDKRIIFKIAGNGDLEKYQQMIEDNGVSENVKLLGWISRDKISKYLKEADIYLLPSYFEGLPMSILEAMSFGLPIISTPVGGIPEAVKDGVNGFIIPPGYIDAFVEKIKLFIHNHDLISQFGKNSKEIVIDKFDINNVINDLDECYKQLIYQ